MRKKKPPPRRLPKKRRPPLAQALEQDRRPTDDVRERRCIVAGESGAPDGLIRFVLSPDGVVTPDFSAKLPGRGAWVTARREMVDAAVHRRLFARAFKAPAETPDDLGAQVDAGFAKSALARLGLARRRSCLVSGFEKVRAAIEAGRAAVVICAAETSEDSIRKVLRGSKIEFPVRLFAADELAPAVGLDDVRHLAITDWSAAKGFMSDVRRLDGFRSGICVEPSQPAGGADLI